MPRRIKTILLLTGLILFLSECGTLKIPANYRYTAWQLKREITGNWIKIKLNSKIIAEPDTILAGELIAIQSDTIYLITPDGLKGVHVSSIDNADLYMYMNQAGLYAALTGLLYLPDMMAALVTGIPAFLLLGVPWIVTGSIVTTVEGSNHANILNYPNFCWLEELKKFARFPQGMPPDIDKTRFHLIKGD